MSIYGAETIGTAILILLGDGVVAATLLARSKAENGGWIVITFGWAMGVAMAVYAIGAFSGGASEPGGDARLRRDRRHGLERRAEVPRR